MSADIAVRLVEVDARNWRDLVKVAPHPHQESFVAPVAYYLCLAAYGGDWQPLAIEADGVVVGHVMWAVGEADHSVWLGGLVIDAAAQRRGRLLEVCDYGPVAVRPCSLGTWPPTRTVE